MLDRSANLNKSRWVQGGEGITELFSPVPDTGASSAPFRAAGHDDSMNRLRGYVYELSGLRLHPSDDDALTALLMEFGQTRSLTSVEQVLGWLRVSEDSSLVLPLIEQIYASPGAFFHNADYFRAIGELCLPELLEKRAGTKRLRVLCLESGSGQDAYSMAMLLKQSIADVGDWDISVIATDQSSSRVHRARQGVFTPEEVGESIPEEYLQESFVNGGLTWKVRPACRELITFQRLRLDAHCRRIPECDIILARGLLRGLEGEEFKQLIGKLRSRLHPEGYLLVDAQTPSLTGSGLLERDCPFGVSVYGVRQLSVEEVQEQLEEAVKTRETLKRRLEGVEQAYQEQGEELEASRRTEGKLAEELAREMGAREEALQMIAVAQETIDGLISEKTGVVPSAEEDPGSKED